MNEEKPDIIFEVWQIIVGQRTISLLNLMKDTPNIAVFDLGTNTFHLLLAELTTDGFRIIHRKKIGVLLGKNGISNGQISEEAQQRAFEALKKLNEILIPFPKTNLYIKAFGTSAFRSTENGNAFAEAVSKIIGIEVEVIDGLREADLIYNGILASGTVNQEPALIMDIGGGSVEFIGVEQYQKAWSISIEIGGQRLMDKFHFSDPISELELGNLEKFLEEELKVIQPHLNNLKPTVLIGSSGSFDTVAQMYLHKENKGNIEIESLPEYTLKPEVFEYFYSELIKKNRAERMKMPGMILLRVEMIVVAMVLIRKIIGMIEAKEVRVSTYSLKEGAVYEYFNLIRFKNQPPS